MAKVLLTLFLPPVRVWLRAGLGGPFWLCLLLTLLWWLPGVLYAFWYARRPTRDADCPAPRRRT
jgi:uncharacterized membrane protein YqaE (UPF0057 family)